LLLLVLPPSCLGLLRLHPLLLSLLYPLLRRLFPLFLLQSRSLNAMDRDRLVAQAEATTPSPSPSMAKAGIYGARRGPTSRSTSSATVVVVAATFESESVINVSATSSVAAAVPEPVSEHDNVTSSNLHSHIQSTVSI
ncbi:hypothetical protein C8F01DRAFT_1165988, partial [Mycena amicta]